MTQDSQDLETRLSETLSDLINLLRTDPEKVRQIMIRLDPKESEDLETVSDRLRQLTDLYIRSKYMINSFYYLGVNLYFDPKTGETISDRKSGILTDRPQRPEDLEDPSQ